MPTTRYYFPRQADTAAAPITPAVAGTWGVTAAGFYRAVLKTSKANSLAANVAVAETAAVEINGVIAQYISPALSAGPISGTARMVNRWTYSSVDSAFGRVIIRLVSSDGLTVRGTLWDSQTSAALGISAQSRTFTESALTSLTAQAGDYLVVEIGGRFVNTTTTSRTVTAVVGEPNLTDLAFTSGSSTDGVGWLELILDDVAPDTPTGLVQTDASPTTVTVDWTPAATGGTPTSYEVSVDGETPLDVGNVTSYEITGLAPSTSYFAQVRAVNASGTSAYTAPITATTSDPDPEVPGPPINLVQAGATDTSISVGWEPPTTGGTPTSYETRINGGTITDNGNVLTKDFTGLTASTAYTIEVRSKNSAGTSSWVSESFSTDAAGPPAETGVVLRYPDVSALWLGEIEHKRAYVGTDMVYNKVAFIDEPKIDPAHALANRTTSTMLVDGATTGTTLVSGNSAVVDDAMASTIAGTLAMRTKAMPAPNDDTLRVSALIKVDKTAGRYSYVGVATGALTSSPDVEVGYLGGTGFRVHSANFATFGTPTIIAEAKCVDGAWYRVSLTVDNVTTKNTTDTSAGKARVSGTIEPVDPANIPANPWYPEVSGARFDAVGAGNYIPSTLVARTNSALGTIKNVYYIDSALGATSNGTDPVDDAPITMQGRMGDGTDVNDSYYLWSKGKAAPLRIIVTAGGSGVYGGLGGWGHANGRTGHPYDAFRQFWRDLADLGYTVLHTQALHEGWGADDHLAKQQEALTTIKNEFGADSRLYYLGYSMGGLSAWRAIMGRASFPSIRAAYIVAGATRLENYYDIPMFSQIQTRWPDEEALDSPYDFDGAALIARETRVRCVTSTGDTNVPKVDNHDVMKAKYGASGLFSELVHDGIGHFDPTYWDAQDCVDFFEGADL
jgi:hypothetical protein